MASRPVQNCWRRREESLIFSKFEPRHLGSCGILEHTQSFTLAKTVLRSGGSCIARFFDKFFILNGFLMSARRFPNPVMPLLEPACPFLEPATRLLEPAWAFLEPASQFLDPATSFLDLATAFLDSATRFLEPVSALLESVNAFLELASSFLQPATAFLELATPGGKRRTQFTGLARRAANGCGQMACVGWQAGAGNKKRAAPASRPRALS
jgi:hypothetical protein